MLSGSFSLRGENTAEREREAKRHYHKNARNLEDVGFMSERRWLARDKFRRIESNRPRADKTNPRTNRCCQSFHVPWNFYARSWVSFASGLKASLCAPPPNVRLPDTGTYDMLRILYRNTCCDSCFDPLCYLHFARVFSFCLLEPCKGSVTPEHTRRAYTFSGEATFSLAQYVRFPTVYSAALSTPVQTHRFLSRH